MEGEARPRRTFTSKGIKVCYDVSCHSVMATWKWFDAIIPCPLLLDHDPRCTSEGLRLNAQTSVIGLSNASQCLPSLQSLQKAIFDAMLVPRLAKLCSHFAHFV